MIWGVSCGGRQALTGVCVADREHHHAAAGHAPSGGGGRPQHDAAAGPARPPAGGLLRRQAGARRAAPAGPLLGTGGVPGGRPAAAAGRAARHDALPAAPPERLPQVSRAPLPASICVRVGSVTVCSWVLDSGSDLSLTPSVGRMSPQQMAPYMAGYMGGAMMGHMMSGHQGQYGCTPPPHHPHPAAAGPHQEPAIQRGQRSAKTHTQAKLQPVRGAVYLQILTGVQDGCLENCLAPEQRTSKRMSRYGQMSRIIDDLRHHYKKYLIFRNVISFVTYS